MIPPQIRRQYQEAMAMPDLTREEAETRFPELLDWLRERVDLVQLMRDAGVDLQPVSPDYPSVYVAHHACPHCDGTVGVQR